MSHEKTTQQATAPNSVARGTTRAIGIEFPWGAACVVPIAAVIGGWLSETPSSWMLAAGSAAAGVLMTAWWCRSGLASAVASTVVPARTAHECAHGVAQSDAHEALLRNAIELRAEERTALLDALGDAVILVNSHSETLFSNRAARALLGDACTIAGTSAAVDALSGQVHRAIQGVLSAHGSERRRVECELRRDESIPVVVFVVPVSSGSSGCAAVIVRDVRTEREADRMKSDFVAKASHELRTPLSALRAYAEMLVDGEASDEAQRIEFARIILSESTRLSDLVDRMLDIGRIESGMARACHESVDFTTLASECVNEQQSEAARRRITLSVARASRGSSASADRALIKQVVLNLLSNALKYTPEGGVVTVEVDVDNLARTVVVSVRDTGLGIPTHALPRLFGKFYRVENHERVAKGTGLGLNLCRNIVEALHGGQIGVESEPDKGSRFWFAIPMEQAGRKAA